MCVGELSNAVGFRWNGWHGQTLALYTWGRKSVEWNEYFSLTMGLECISVLYK